MKDYTITKEERKNFILNYEPKGDKIVVYYANGHSDKLSNTKENREYLNSIMEKQFDNSNKITHEINSDSEMGLLASIIIGGSIVFFPMLLMLSVMSLKTMLVVLALILVAGGIGIGISTYNHNKSKRILKDIEKSEYFLTIKTN